MKGQAVLAAALVTITAAEAKRRIEEWFGRGYIFFSDVRTRSTHLARVEDSEGRSAPSHVNDAHPRRMA